MRTRTSSVIRRIASSRWKWAVAVVVCAACAFVWMRLHPHYDTRPHTVLIHVTHANIAGATRVLVVGGSVARGWGDKGGPGYILRAFESLPGRQPYVVTNAATPGSGPEQVAARFAAQLKKFRPQVVVISWGTLDDVHRRTPLDQFEQAIEDEIRESLRARAVVLVITPPVTRATFIRYSTLEPEYVEQELAAASHFRDPNVYVFNVFDEMQRYLADHHLDYGQYEADGWHPNTAGHELAAWLLVSAMDRVFDGGAIQYQDQAEIADRGASTDQAHMVQ